MGIDMEFFIRFLLIGIGATGVMDIWAFFVKRVFGVPSLNYGMVGRWIGHINRGTIAHTNIAKANPIPGEQLIGWVAHYGIGVLFAALLMAVAGLGWARSPSFIPALSMGVLTVLAPYFLLQPAMGLGMAAAKTPNPNVMRLRSLMAHTSFGVGLYIAARICNLLPW